MTGGLILAGGRSSRFGSEKAVARLAGETLLARAHHRLAGRCALIGVSAPAGSGAAAQGAQLGVTVLADPPGAPRGPLAGVLSGLLWVRRQGGDLLVTIPCDTPLAPPDLVERLAGEIGEAQAAAARTPGGVQALCAAWRISLIEPLAAAIAHGAHPRVQQILADAGVVFVDFPDDQAFANINTPEDLVRAEEALAAR